VAPLLTSKVYGDEGSGSGCVSAHHHAAPAAHMPSKSSIANARAMKRKARISREESRDKAAKVADYNRAMNTRCSRRIAGFTLIEIMVVIVILGILAALVVPRVLERPDEARAIAAKNDIAAIMQALKLYRLDNQRYPTTEQG